MASSRSRTQMSYVGPCHPLRVYASCISPTDTLNRVKINAKQFIDSSSGTRFLGDPRSTKPRLEVVFFNQLGTIHSNISLLHKFIASHGPRLLNWLWCEDLQQNAVSVVREHTQFYSDFNPHCWDGSRHCINNAAPSPFRTATIVTLNPYSKTPVSPEGSESSGDDLLK